MACCFPWGTSTEEAVRRRHVYEIRDYRNLLTSVGPNEYVSSAPFSVGGFDWAVRFYPNGAESAVPGYVSAFADLVTPGAKARASFELTLLPWSPGARGPAFKARRPRKFHGVRGSSAWGRWSFVKRTKLESPVYLRDDTVRIQCDITVFVKRRPVLHSAGAQPVPPSELSADLGKLMMTDSGGGAPAPPADVLILVGAESFAAHSLVLWMRCRELYYMLTVASSCITISESDVQPAVFSDLLRYIYTETLPAAMDDLTASSAQKAEKLRALVAAAVRYKMDRLKLVCESALCTTLDASTVVATLAVAEQLHLTTLRSACIKFIASSAGHIE